MTVMVTITQEEYESLKGKIEHEPSLDAPHGLEDIRRWVVAEKKRIEAEGNFFDDMFRCVDEGGDVFYFDPEVLTTHVLVPVEIAQLVQAMVANTNADTDAGSLARQALELFEIKP